MLQNDLKKINELSFKISNSKDVGEKDQLTEKLTGLLNLIKKDAISSFKNESDIKKFLDNICKMHKYSYNNQILIYLQYPNASYVASYNTFRKMGYHVKKDETGIKILRPSFYTVVKIKNPEEKGSDIIKPYFALTEKEKLKYKNKYDDDITFHSYKFNGFKIGTVFDASQTSMPLEEINKKLNPVLKDDRANGIEDIFIKAIYRDGFKVKYMEHSKTGAKGYCDHENREIVVLKGLNDLMRLKVVIHEYAHALAHEHLEKNHEEYVEHRNKYETEAESIAYVVCKYLGLNTSDYSNMYLYSWSLNRDFKEIDDSFSTIINYSKKIIDNFEKMLAKEKTLDKEKNVKI